ncbi:MAG: ROK family protein [Planctomycetota bacterium]
MNASGEPEPGKDVFLGLDLGGQCVKAGIGAGGDATLDWAAEFPSRSREGRDAICTALCDATTAALDAARARGARVRAIGFGTPGIVDPATGVVLYEVANLPGWRGVNLRALFRDRFQLSSCIEHDANAAAIAEARFGAGRGARFIVMATLGTGIGGGAVIDGALLHGARGAAMELGHVPIEAHGRECPCGKRGCLEAYAGGRALLRDWRLALAGAGIARVQEREVAALELRDFLVVATTRDERVEAEAARLAAEILANAAQWLGVGFVAALHLLNPDVLVVGGGIVDAAPQIVAQIEREVRARALPKALAGLAVRRAELGNRAGVLGAIELAASAWRGGSGNGSSRGAVSDVEAKP